MPLQLLPSIISYSLSVCLSVCVRGSFKIARTPRSNTKQHTDTFADSLAMSRSASAHTFKKKLKTALFGTAYP